jgi:hypothetical protein
MRIAVNVIVTLSLSAALAYLVAEHPSQVPDYLGVLAAIIGVAMVLLGVRDEQVQAREEGREESERRVREAETELEVALRRVVETPEEDAPLRVEPEMPGPAVDAIANVFTGTWNLGLPELWKVTHARLSLFHRIGESQARQSFRNAQLAMGAGFLLLVVFVVTAVLARSTAGSIAAGGLGAVAAGLSAYIAKTFVKSQEMTTEALQRYYDEPLALSRYLAAERLVMGSGLSESQRAELLHALVHSMVTGSPPTRMPPQRSSEPTAETPTERTP